MPNRCSCESCWWDAELQVWRFNAKSLLGDRLVPWTICWHEPHCPVCFTGLGEGGETTAAPTIRLTIGWTEYFDGVDIPEEGGTYYLVPATLPEEASPADPAPAAT